MNRDLAKAVTDVFREERSGIYERLAAFEYRQWVKTYSWLDASGLALYFRDRVRLLGIESAVPDRALERLEKNAADNRNKTEEMFEEFLEINRRFKVAGVTYVNLKGFSLIPDACADAALRCQFDLDFLVARSDTVLCEQILEQNGYVLTGVGKDVREYKAGSGQVPSARDLYKAKQQKSVEIHFADSEKNEGAFSTENLSRIQWNRFDGFEIPAHSDCDKFLGLTLHLFKHLRSEWTRASWVLEYANFIRFHCDNEQLWLEVKRCMTSSPRTKLAIGAVTLLADRHFGSKQLPNILRGAISELPVSVRLWIERYGSNVIFAKFPGTKFYLLLEKSISRKDDVESFKMRGRLFPFHLPPKISVGREDAGLLERLKQLQVEANFVLFRLRFHVTQGIAYMIEASRWKRNVASLQS
jgi:hypothetical protein